jgi:homoserine kinase type II
VAKSEFTKRDANAVAAEYGLPKVNAVKPLESDAESDRLQFLLETTRGKFIVDLDERKSELELKREHDLVLFLRKHGYPCRAPLADRRGRHVHEFSGRMLSVYRRIDGHELNSDSVNANQLENIGHVIADLHLITKAYKKGGENHFSFDRVAELYDSVRGRLPSYMKKIVRTLDEELEYLGNYLEMKLPKGTIHGDVRSSRLLVKGDKVVALLNFEIAGRGKFILDLATAVNALCFDDGQYDLKRFEALIAGYESLRTLSLAEWDAFPNELRFSAFRFTIARLNDFFAASGDARQQINKDVQDFYERLLILRREKDGGMESMLMAMATGYDYRKYQKVKAVERRSR